MWSDFPCEICDLHFRNSCFKDAHVHFLMTVLYCKMVGTIPFIDIWRLNFTLRKTLKVEKFVINILYILCIRCTYDLAILEIDTKYGKTNLQ